ncbi:hypothetical protein D3C87_1350000 [compost metagenome]
MDKLLHERRERRCDSLFPKADDAELIICDHLGTLLVLLTSRLRTRGPKVASLAVQSENMKTPLKIFSANSNQLPPWSFAICEL